MVSADFSQLYFKREISSCFFMFGVLILDFWCIATMYLHRCFFAQALVEHPADPLRSPYAPSFLAGYRAACATVTLLREQFEMHPRDVARVWVVWTHAFSAT